MQGNSTRLHVNYRNLILITQVYISTSFAGTFLGTGTTNDLQEKQLGNCPAINICVRTIFAIIVFFSRIP